MEKPMGGNRKKIRLVTHGFFVTSRDDRKASGYVIFPYLKMKKVASENIL